MPAPLLRPYQVDSLQAIADCYARGQNRVLIKKPTGTGKTVTFAAIPQFPAIAGPLSKYPQRGAWMLVIAHREELLEQAAAKIGATNRSLVVDIEQANRVASRYANVIVASIQTLAAMKFRRLKRLLRDHTFRVVIVDEAHHAAAASYRTALVHLGFLPAADATDREDLEAADYDDVAVMNQALEGWDRMAPKDRLLVGVTATPNRSDAIGLGCVFQTIAYSYALKQAIEDGWLVKITPWVIESDVSLDNVKLTAGDFNQKDLAAAVNQEKRNELAVAAWEEHAYGLQTLGFTVDVAHAHAMASTFRRHGHAWQALSGETPKDDRRMMLEQFRNHRLTGIANCMVLTEGTDLPMVRCILHAKPTKSSTLYEQMTGRGLRPYEGKVDCIVLDVVDIARKHSLQTAPILYGLPPGLSTAGEDLKQLESELDKFKEKYQTIDVDELLRTGRLTLEQLRAKATTFDIWKIPDLGALAQVVTMNWIKTAADRFKMTYPWGNGNETIEVATNLLGKFEIVTTVREPDAGGLGYSSRQRTMAQDLPDAQTALQTAETWLRQERAQAARLRDREAPWRSRPASAKQKDLLRNLRVPFAPQLTAGQASDLIDLQRSRRR